MSEHLSQRVPRDKSFATFASAWCAGFIAHREGLDDSDREAFTAKLMADYERWCGPFELPPLVTENVVIAVARAIHDAYQPDEGDDLEVVWVDAVRAALQRMLWGRNGQ